MHEQNKLNLRLQLNLQFFNGEKTEKPTGKKLRDARQEGQVAKSQEVSTAFLFISSFFMLKMFADNMYYGITSLMTDTLSLISEYVEFFPDNLSDPLYQKNFADIVIRVGLIVAPLLLAIMASGVVSNVIQVGWHPTTKVLKPKFSKLNPLQGFKRMFSMMAVVELIKSIVKLFLISYVVYSVVKKELNVIPTVPFMDLFMSIAFFSDLAFRVGVTVGACYVAIALFDYVFQKMKHIKDLKMSKQEIKDEYKQAEGNPEIKGKIKQKMREASMRRMMQDIPSADVIITNPTHFAIAIRYKHNQDLAPVVVGKGVDHVAKKIRETAKEHNIEIVENKPLARALYASVELGQPIPPDLYQSVAEILAFVYKLKNKL